MAQFRPRGRPQPTQVQQTRASDGRTFEVSASAVRSLSSSWSPEEILADAGVTPSAYLKTLDYDDICASAVAAGRKPPSKRTVRRWKQHNRIPDAKVAELIERRAIIERLGGVRAAAAALGRSTSAIYRWRSGASSAMRADARARRNEALALLRLANSGIDPSRGAPRISFTADVKVIWQGDVDYDYRESKAFVIGPPDGQDYARGNSMSTPMIREFAIAMAQEDHARMVTILEEYTSTDVADFGVYDNATGFHFDSVGNIRVSW